jgi:predicted nucleic acid-binding protein
MEEDGQSKVRGEFAPGVGLMKAVIDSDILIDYLQGMVEAKDEINKYDEPLYSMISWMEVMCGAETEEEKQSAESLFKSMIKIDLTLQIAQRAVDERKSLKLKLPDAVILATADCEGCILVTRNTKDFDEDDPRVRIPY